MKRTELEELIKETIVEILKEATPQELKQKQLIITNRTADIAELNKQMSLEKDSKKQAELKARLDVLKAELAQAQAIKEAKDEDDDDAKDEKIKNAQPTKSELKKNASVSKITDALAKVVKDFKATNEEYKKAEGDKKKDLLDKLKDLTEKKKKLEKALKEKEAKL